MSITTEEPTYQYEVGEEADIPTRPRFISPGRPSLNPHAKVVEEIAGTGQTRRFLVADPGDEDEARKLINRHTRYLRLAAHQNERGIRIGAKVLDDGRIQIAFKDIDYVRRGGRKASPDEDDA
jgi:hypothetical protein